jgi:hypothetical protein
MEGRIMAKKFFMLAMVGCLLAWSSLASATAVSFYSTEYIGHALVTNTGTGASNAADADNASGVNVSAFLPATGTPKTVTASAAAPLPGKLVYADAYLNTKNRYAESWAEAILCFKAPCEEVELTFHYFMSAETAGKAEASAQLYVSFTDFDTIPVQLFNDNATASSTGAAGDESDSQSYEGDFSLPIKNLVIDKEYCFDLQAYYVYADSSGATTDPTASAVGYISNFAANCDGGPPIVTPVPGSWLFMVSGLMGLLGVGWRRQS